MAGGGFVKICDGPCALDIVPFRGPPRAIAVELSPGTRLDAPSIAELRMETHDCRRTNSSSIIAIWRPDHRTRWFRAQDNDKVICLSPTEVCPGTAAIVVTIFSLFATTALLVLDPLGEQLADHTPGIAQEFPAFAGRTIDSPSNAPLPFLDRAQVSVAL